MIKTKCKLCGGTGKTVDPREQGAKMRILRVRSGLTQTEVARRIGVKSPYLCDLEQGYRRWTAEISKAYLAALKQTK